MDMINYKKYIPYEHPVKNLDDALDTLHMFEHQFSRKECAMTVRDDKWADGLYNVIGYLKSLKEEK